MQDRSFFQRRLFRQARGVRRLRGLLTIYGPAQVCVTRFPRFAFTSPNNNKPYTHGRLFILDILVETAETGARALPGRPKNQTQPSNLPHSWFLAFAFAKSSFGQKHKAKGCWTSLAFLCTAAERRQCWSCAYNYCLVGCVCKKLLSKCQASGAATRAALPRWGRDAREGREGRERRREGVGP